MKVLNNYGWTYNAFTGLWDPEKEYTDHDAGDKIYSDGKTYRQACSDELERVTSLWNARTGESIHEISKTLETYSNEIDKSGELTSYTEEIPGVLTKVEAEYEMLVKAQKSLEALQKTLENLRTALKDYTTALENWEDTANEYEDYDSDLIQDDLHQLDVINGREEPTEDEVADGLVRVRLDCGDRSDSDRNEDDINKFEERIKNTIDLIISYRKSMESIRYHGVQIVGKGSNNEVFSGEAGIKDLSAFDSAAKKTPLDSLKKAVNIKDIPVYQDELDAYIESTFDLSDELDSILEVTSDNNPKLHNYENLDDVAGMTDLDIWLHDKFDAMEVTEDIAKGLLDTLKGMFNNILPNIDEYNAYENKTLSNKEMKDVGELPSNGVVDEADRVEDAGKDVKDKLDAGTKAGSLFSEINFEELFEGERDRLYTLEYIMKMFTYETSALEGIYNMGRQDVEDDNIYLLNVDGEMKEIAPGTADGIYNNQWKSDEECEGYWGEKRLTFTQNKSMTNKLQDWNNNYLYGREVEYILYGGNTESSRTAMAATLMFTRFGLNMGPVLRCYWDKQVVINIASGIATATSGVVPAPIVKMVICMGVCAAESAVDLNYLKAGLPVIFYKNNPDDQMFIQLPEIDAKSFVENMKSNAGYSGELISKKTPIFTSSDSEENGKLICLSYSDYLRMFLLIRLHTSEENIYKRTADIIQLNMRNNPELGGYDAFKMQDALTGFKLSYKVKVEPLLLKIPFARQYGSEEVINSDTWNKISGEMTRKY